MVEFFAPKKKDTRDSWETHHQEQLIKAEMKKKGVVGDWKTYVSEGEKANKKYKPLAPAKYQPKTRTLGNKSLTEPQKGTKDK